MPTEIELLLLAWQNVRKNLGRDIDVPPYDDTVADAIEDLDVAMDQLRAMFEDPYSAYEMADLEPVVDEHE